MGYAASIMIKENIEMNEKNRILKVNAEKGRFLYRSGAIEMNEAKSYIMPYIEAINERAKELAKKYNQKFKPVTFTGFVR